MPAELEIHAQEKLKSHGREMSVDPNSFVRTPSEESSEEASPSQSGAQPMSPASSGDCLICGYQFSVTKLRHKCRLCGAAVCSACSPQRVRVTVGADKVRACTICAQEWRRSHAEELHESVDVRMQMNASLKELLKEKYEATERLKQLLVELIDSQAFLQEAPSLTAPFKFSSSMGLDRINFADLVRYLDGKVAYLSKRTDDMKTAYESESTSLAERRRNFGFLQERTDKAEIDAARVGELVQQRDRLRDIFKSQAVRLRALKDRVDFLEDQSRRPPPVAEGQGPLGTVGQGEFIGDVIVDSLCPCLNHT